MNIYNGLKSFEMSTYCFSSAICFESVCSIIAKAFLPCLRGFIFSLDNSHSAIFWRKKARQKIEKCPLNFCLRVKRGAVQIFIDSQCYQLMFY